MPTRHAIAAIANREGLDSQILLEEAAARWRDAGLKVVGLLAENNLTEGECSAAFLRDIASGQRFPIALDAAPPGTSCHLDATGLDAACAGLMGQLTAADVVILSKFGKTEAGGHGLRPAYLAAFEAGRPLLTTVSAKHAAAWAGFAPDAARLEPEAGAVNTWWASVRA